MRAVRERSSGREGIIRFLIICMGMSQSGIRGFLSVDRPRIPLLITEAYYPRFLPLTYRVVLGVHVVLRLVCPNHKKSCVLWRQLKAEETVENCSRICPMLHEHGPFGVWNSRTSVRHDVFPKASFSLVGDFSIWLKPYCDRRSRSFLFAFQLIYRRRV